MYAFRVRAKLPYVLPLQLLPGQLQAHRLVSPVV